MQNLKKISDRITCGGLLGSTAIEMNRHGGDRLRDLGVTFGCIATFAAPYVLTRNGREQPHHYSIWFVMEGAFTVTLPEKTVSLEPGDVVIFPSWIPRIIELVEGDRQTHMAFNVKMDGAPEWLVTEQVVVRPSTEMHRLKRVMEGLNEEEQRDRPDRFAIERFSDLVACYLTRDLHVNRETYMNETHLRLERLMHEIRGTLAEDWPVQRMAQNLCVSRAQLFRQMRRYVQLTPNEFVSSERIRLSRHLLETSDYSLDLIAERVGYANPYTFSNTFLRREGIRPGAFRRRAKEES